MSNGHIYTEEEDSFLKENGPLYFREELTKLFNEHFGLHLTVNAIKCHCIKKKISSNIKKYSKEEYEWLKENSALYPRKKLVEIFNAKFNSNRSFASINSFCKEKNFKAPTDGRYEHGHKTWNTGLATEEIKTHFSEESYSSLMKSLANGREKHKIGDQYLMKIGDIRVPYIITSTDYSIPFKKRMIPETRYVLKQHGIEVPKGYSVVHLDGDVMNNDISNLKIVSDREKIVIVNNGWFENKELIETALMYAELYCMISNHKKEKK